MVRRAYVKKGPVECDAAVKPFHNNGCSCLGGVGSTEEANIVWKSDSSNYRQDERIYSKIDRESYSSNGNEVMKSTMEIRPEALYARENGNTSGIRQDQLGRRKVRKELDLHYDKADLAASEVAFHLHSLEKGADPSDQDNIKGGSFQMNLGVWRKMEKEAAEYVQRTGNRLIETIETKLDANRKGVIRNIKVSLKLPNGDVPNELIKYTKNVEFVNFRMAKASKNGQ